jgi:acyl-CoA dehydrogenase
MVPPLPCCGRQASKRARRWISGAGDPRCKVHIVMGKSAPDHADPYKRQSVVIVPTDTPGVRLVRPMTVFGYDDAPEGHYEVIYDNVRVPLSNLVLGWGCGFEIIQGRLGYVLCATRLKAVVDGTRSPGRIHHCMRSIGIAQMALDTMILRVTDPSRMTFGKQLHQHGKSKHRKHHS